MTVLQDLPPLETLDGCTPDKIPAEVFESDVPLVLKGLVSEWPAVKACSDSISSAATYINRFWSGQDVTVYLAESDANGRFFYNDDFTGFNFRAGTAPLNLVFQKLAEQAGEDSPQAIYVGSTNVDRWLPGFRSQNDVAVTGDDLLVSFWMGNQTRVSAHFDFPDNIACVVAGRRRFTLFPPEQIDNLYIGPVDLTPSGQAISLVDFSEPDYERFPRFEKALETAHSHELEPGDAIFIPSMWWHHVESLDPFNLLVNYWWCATPTVMGAPTTALLSAILAIRELPERQREIWRRLFDHYVFSSDESVYAHIPESGRGCLAPLDEKSARKLRAYLAERMKL